MADEEKKVFAALTDPVDYDVVRKAYGWTFDIYGEIHGLTAGDQGFEPTGIKSRDIAIWHAKLDAIERFCDNLHADGCQAPHGGKCQCGWNLISVALEELKLKYDQHEVIIESLKLGCGQLDEDTNDKVADILVRIKDIKDHLAETY